MAEIPLKIHTIKNHGRWIFRICRNTPNDWKGVRPWREAFWRVVGRKKPPHGKLSRRSAKSVATTTALQSPVALLGLSNIRISALCKGGKSTFFEPKNRVKTARTFCRFLNS